MALISICLLFSMPVSAQSDDAVFLDRDKQELGILSEIPRIVRREKDALFITLPDGLERVYEDHERACVANDYAHCVRHQAYAYDPKRRVLVLLNRYYESWDYELVSVESGESIIVSGDPQGAPAGRPYWAAVDDGESGPGEMRIVALEDGAFRILGQTKHPQCKFDRWDAELAFFAICWGPEKNRGEFLLTLGAGGTLRPSRTLRKVSDEEYRAIGVEP